MSFRKRKGLRTALVSALMAGMLAVPSTLPVAQADTTHFSESNPQALQNAFEQASAEFGVPLSVLMSVAYNESRWDFHGDEPSMSGGYGVMHLTQLTPELAHGSKGDEEVSLPDANDPALHTLDTAAALIGEDAEVLKQDLHQNIRGGAALLAQYARETVGTLPENAADWYGAVAKYSGSDSAEIAKDFADSVYTTIQTGAARTNEHGQQVVLTAEAVTPNASTADPLHLRNAEQSGADCPNGLACRFIPANYQQFSSSVTNYGNYDLANRPADGLDIRYIIIHDVEGSYQSAIKTFQAKSYVSAHYVINSENGQVTQMLRPEHVGWHAGNWYFNSHSIGVEHSGFAVEGGTWYSEQMYRSSAKLVKYLAERYNIPLDRQHILGHDDLPGLTTTAHAKMHWDPGAYFDWAHYFDLLGASINPADAEKDSNIVTIDVNFNQNEPDLRYGSRVLEPQPSNFVYMRTAPSFDAPLISDAALQPTGAPGTTQIYDWGNKATIGQTFYLADQSGDWTAVYFGAKKAWFHNPNGKHTVPGKGVKITPKAGLTSIPVYGAAFPEDAAYAKAGIPVRVNNALQYRIPAGQVYVSAGEPVQSVYFHAKIFNAPESNKVVKGEQKYYQINFNHRSVFVKASDVEVVE